MKKLKKIITLLAVFGLGLSSLVALVPVLPEKTEAALFQVKLNEFMPNPSSGSEWVEVYNPNSTPVDISGYKLDDETGGGSVFTIPGGTVIGGYGFYLKERTYGFDDSGSDEARLLDSTDAVIDSYAFTGTTDGKTYARSIDGAGVWSDGTTDPTKGKSNDLTAPMPGTVNDGLGADVNFIATLSSVSANWSGFGDLESVLIGYEYSVTGSDSSTPITWTLIGPEFSSFTESAVLTEGVLYSANIRAINNAGLKTEVSSDGQTPDLTGPTPPSSLVINPRNIKDNEVKLSWDASTDSGSGVDVYEIWRSASPWERIGEVEETTTNFTDVIGEGVLDDVWVEYKIIAKDELENPSPDYSNIAGTQVDTTAPGAPVISFSFVGNLVNLVWPSIDGASTYDVYRDGVIVQSGTAAGYVDKNSQGGETHSYYVVAVDEAGNLSPASNALVIYILKPQVSSISTSQILGAATGAGEVKAQEEPSQEKIDEGQVGAEETSAPEETAEEAKTNWSLIIAIIIAAAIVISGVLYWWYAREGEEDEI